MQKKINAHTLVELIIVIVILGVLAFIAIPRLQFATLYRKQADTVARKIVTDLRRTRQLAISNAATNPTTGFELQMIGSSPYLSYQIVDDSNSVTVDSQTIDSKVSVICFGSNFFRFGPLGNKTAGGTYIYIYVGGRTYRIVFYNATGMVRCQRIL